MWIRFVTKSATALKFGASTTAMRSQEPVTRFAASASGTLRSVLAIRGALPTTVPIKI